MQGEFVISAIPVNWKKGFFKTEMHTLVVTNYRLIMAKLTSNLWKQIAQEKKSEVESKGGGMLKKMWAAATTGFTYYTRYVNFDPEYILNETPENIWIDPNTVKSITLRKGRIIRDEYGNKQGMHKLKIVLPDATLNLEIRPEFNLDDAANSLFQLFGNRLDYR